MAYEIPASVGIGLRFPHFKDFLATSKPNIAWLEVHPENYKIGSSLKILEEIRTSYPLSLHGIGLSLGSPTLDLDHLKFLKFLCDLLNPGLVSEHVAWSVLDGHYLNDLLPLPYTQESLDLLVKNIEQTQEFLGRQILVENPSSYLTFESSTFSEEEFMVNAARRSGCKILLDINNIYVSSMNHGFCPQAYIKAFRGLDLVKEIHLAGHRRVSADLLVDDHGSTISEEVWDLYSQAVEILGLVPTLVEWDSNVPPLETLLGEAKKAQKLMETICETV
jgi:hypothetical protein